MMNRIMNKVTRQRNEDLHKNPENPPAQTLATGVEPLT
jgi:hypothetical protein